MKQILIVNSTQTSVATSVVKINPGQLYFDPAADNHVVMGIGLSNGQGAIIMPPIEAKDLIKVAKSMPAVGQAFTASFTVPTITSGNYTVVLVKKGTMTGERNQYTATDFVKPDTTKTAAQMAVSLANQINNKVGQFGLQATVNGATITIAANTDIYDAWTVKLGDGLAGVAVTETAAKKPVGDKVYVEALAKYCAAGKGFNYLAEDGKELYPGYPEAVENLVPAVEDDEITNGYVIFDFRFATHRIAGKQLDEAIAQDVFIAVPITCKNVVTALSNLVGA